MSKRPRIGVIGLGKVGSSLAAAIASRGYKVVGVDKDKNLVDKINGGEAPFPEKDLQKFLDKYGKRIHATTSYDEAYENSDIMFIVVPTPSTKSGKFSNRYVKEVFRELGKRMRNDNRYKLIVLSSTVVPTSMDNELVPLLRKTSGKVCGKEFGACYNPMLIAIGNVIAGFLQPELIIIGESDKRAGNILEDFWKELCITKPVIKRMNFINAEISKICINCFLTLRISSVNALSQVCERVRGADVDIVMDAVTTDSRIGGKKLSTAGLGYGGPCLPRDNRAFSYFANRVGVPSWINVATDEVNDLQVERVIKCILENSSDDDVVGVLGLSYKPNVYITEESQGLYIAKKLAEKRKTLVYDPMAMEDAKKALGDSVIYCSSPGEVVSKSQVIIVTVPWEEFKKLKGKDFGRLRVLIDCWRIFNKKEIGGRVKYIRLGRGDS